MGQVPRAAECCNQICIDPWDLTGPSYCLADHRSVWWGAPHLRDLYSKHVCSIMVYFVLKAMYIINKIITISLRVKQYFTASNEDLPEHGLL